MLVIYSGVFGLLMLAAHNFAGTMAIRYVPELVDTEIMLTCQVSSMELNWWYKVSLLSIVRVGENPALVLYASVLISTTGTLRRSSHYDLDSLPVVPLLVHYWAKV